MEICLTLLTNIKILCKEVFSLYDFLLLGREKYDNDNELLAKPGILI